MFHCDVALSSLTAVNSRLRNTFFNFITHDCFYNESFMIFSLNWQNPNAIQDSIKIWFMSQMGGGYWRNFILNRI